MASLDSLARSSRELTDRHLDDVDGGMGLAVALLIIATIVSLEQFMEMQSD